MRAHTHTHTHIHRGTRTHRHSDHTKLNHTQLKTGRKCPGDLAGMDENISTEQKTWHVYNFGKRNDFRLGLNESREGLCRAGRGGHSMLMD